MLTAELSVYPPDALNLPILADLLASQALGELRSADRLLYLATSGYLTQREAQLLQDQVVKIRAHADAIEACRGRYPASPVCGEGWSRPADPTGFYRVSLEDPVFVLPDVILSERMTYYALHAAYPLFLEAEDVDTAVVLVQLIAEGGRRLATHRVLWRRLRRHPEIGAQLRTLMRDRLREGIYPRR